MPYIKQEIREQYDGDLDSIIDWGKRIEKDKKSGICNYIITKLLSGIIQPENYNDYNSLIGVLECCKMEFYRRAIATYEDKAIQKNGDLPEFKS